MYETFYKLDGDPFRLSPDPRFSFRHRSYAKARAYLRYGLERAEGFVVVIGSPGTGKTTLIEDLLAAYASSDLGVARLTSSNVEGDDLLRMVAYAFGVDAEGIDKATLLRRLANFLIQQRRAERRALLIVDEAQDLSAGGLEELRLLTNLQLDGSPLLQIFLLGQEGLGEIVRAPRLEQLHQRLIAACHLKPLTSTDTRAYVDHRLERVGWHGDPSIAEDAYAAVHRNTGGVPRRVNQLCSRLLLHGALEEKHHLDRRDVDTIVSELREEMLIPQREPAPDEADSDHDSEVAPPSPSPAESPTQDGRARALDAGAQREARPASSDAASSPREGTPQAGSPDTGDVARGEPAPTSNGPEPPESGGPDKTARPRRAGAQSHSRPADVPSGSPSARPGRDKGPTPRQRVSTAAPPSDIERSTSHRPATSEAKAPPGAQARRAPGQRVHDRDLADVPAEPRAPQGPGSAGPTLGPLPTPDTNDDTRRRSRARRTRTDGPPERSPGRGRGRLALLLVAILIAAPAVAYGLGLALGWQPLESFSESFSLDALPGFLRAERSQRSPGPTDTNGAHPEPAAPQTSRHDTPPGEPVGDTGRTANAQAPARPDAAAARADEGSAAQADPRSPPLSPAARMSPRQARASGSAKATHSDQATETVTDSGSSEPVTMSGSARDTQAPAPTPSRASVNQRPPSDRSTGGDESARKPASTQTPPARGSSDGDEKRDSAASTQTPADAASDERPSALSEAMSEALTESQGEVRALPDGRLQVSLPNDASFAFDSSDLRLAFKPVLDKVARVLRRHDDARVSIVGHTDQHGPPDYNRWLSLRRAQAVARYLARQGVDRTRLETLGRGASDPVQAEGPPRANRRVELFVTS